MFLNSAAPFTDTKDFFLNLMPMGFAQRTRGMYVRPWPTPEESQLSDVIVMLPCTMFPPCCDPCWDRMSHLLDSPGGVADRSTAG